LKEIQVIWTDESLSDLEVIFDFVTEQSPKSAKQIIQDILSRTRQLRTFPQSGTLHEIEKTTDREYRYLINGHYKIIYSIDNEVLYLETVIDTRQNPDSLKL